MSNKSNAAIATMGIDIGKNSFHVVPTVGDNNGGIGTGYRWRYAWGYCIPIRPRHAARQGIVT
jgi:hypothetical protein